MWRQNPNMPLVTFYHIPGSFPKQGQSQSRLSASHPVRCFFLADYFGFAQDNHDKAIPWPLIGLSADAQGRKLTSLGV